MGAMRWEQDDASDGRTATALRRCAGRARAGAARARRAQAVGAPCVRRGARGPAAVALAAALVAGAGVACAPPRASPAGGSPALYVANSVDGTVARLDGGTGRPLGPPLPAGAAAVAARRAGPTAASSRCPRAPAAARPLTRLGRAGDGVGDAPRGAGPGRPARPASPATAGATPWWSTARRRRRPAARRRAARCRLTLVDVPAGAVAATAAGCGPHDLVTGLALDDGPGGPVAYLALWRLRPGAARRPRRGGRAAGAAGRVVAVDARTGAPVAVLPLDGVPVLLAARAGAGPARAAGCTPWSGSPARRTTRRRPPGARLARPAPRPPWRSRASGPSTSSPRASSWRPTATPPTPCTTTP